MSDNVDYESLQSKTTSISTKKYILTLSPYISSFFSLLITILSLITIFTPFIQLQTFITGEGLSMNISSLYFIHDIYEINEITDTFALPIDMVAGWTIFIIILLSLYLLAQMDNRFVRVRILFLTVCSRCGFLSYPSYRQALHLW